MVVTMQKHQGFTLVELIIVIVILGVLAVTAAPKFLNLAGDAKGATLDGIKASLNSAGSLVYGKSVIKGVQNAASSTVVNQGATTIATVYGYPAATTTVAAQLLDVDPADFTIAAGNAATYFGSVAADFVVFQAGFVPVDATQPSGCHLVYKAPAGVGTKPTITVYKDGC